MRRFKLVLEYHGSGYYGWQKQEGRLTIQKCVEDAITKFSGKQVQVFASGRTDAGVHAIFQVVHFDLETEISVEKVKCAINHFLKNTNIFIKSVEETGFDFHARFSAKSREYIYIINNSENNSVFLKDRALWIRKDLNMKAMQNAANYLIGKHDFSAFRSKECQAKSPIRTINSISILKSNSFIQISDHPLININITAQSFLHSQVRIIVGSLYEVGIQNWKPEKILEILNSKNRINAGRTAPAHGLYLTGVTYI